MHIPAKVDYAMRAMLELAERDEPATAETLAAAQELPMKFLATILNDLRRAGLVTSRRGNPRGYRLARLPGEITVADVMRAIDASIDGLLAQVHGARDAPRMYVGPARYLQDVWIATRESLCAVLEAATLADIASGAFSVSAGEGSAIPDPGPPEAEPIPR